MATLTAIFNAQDNLSKAMANAGNAGSKTSGIIQKLGKIGSVAMKGIVTAVTVAGTALLAFGKKAVNVGMEYESAMSQVMATMGLDKSTDSGLKAYETLSAAAEKMGATTAFSTTQAADALNYLALAGYDAEKAATALPTVLYLAGAGAMDLASASDMLTDAMSALQIEATQENLTEFSDKLAKTASSSNTSVAQLGEAVLAVGGTAANLKGGVTELTASLGILADAGIKGAEGGTHLRNMINSLQSGRNKSAVSLFKKMGFSAYDAEGNMRSLGDQFKDINAYIAGMDAKGVDNLLRTIFKTTDLAAARAMLAATSNSVESLGTIVDSSLTGTGKTLSDFGIDLSKLAKTFDPLMTQEQFASNMMQQFGLDAETAGIIFGGLSSIVSGTGTRFDELTEKIDNSAGACEAMYRTMLDNLKGDVSIFNSTVEALYIEIFKSTSDTLRNLVQTGTGYMQRLIDAFKIGGFSGLATEMGNVLGDATGVVLGYMPKLIQAGTDVVLAFVDSIGNNADAIANAAAEIGIHLGSAVLKIAPKLASSFVKVAGAAGKALIGAIPKLFSSVPESIYSALGFDKGHVVSRVYQFIATLKVSISKLLRGDTFGAIDSIGRAFNIDASSLEKVKGILTGIGTAFGKVSAFAQKAAGPIGDFIRKFASMGGVEATIAGLVAGFAALKAINIGRNFVNMAKGVKKAGGAMKVLGKALSANKFMLIAAAIAAVVAGIVLLVKNWDKVKSALKGGIDKVFGAGAFDKLSQSMSKVGEGFKKIGDWAKDSWGKMKSAFGEGYKNGGLFGGISAAFSSLKESLSGINWGEIGSKAWEAIKGSFTATGDWIKSIVLGDGYTPDSTWGDVGSKIWETIKNGITATGDWLKEKLGYTPDASWSDIGSDIWEKVKSGITATGDWLKDKLGYTPDDSWGTIGTEIWDKIKNGITATGDWLKEKLGYTPDDSWAQIGTEIWDKIKNGITATGDWLKEKLGYTPDASWSQIGKDIWEKIKNGITATGDWLKDKLGYSPDASWTTIGNDIWEKIKSGITATGDWLKDKLGYTPDDSWSEIGSQIWEKIKTGLDGAAESGGLLGGLATALEIAMTIAENIASSVAQAVETLSSNGTIGTIWTSVQSIVESILNIVKQCVSAFTGVGDGLDIDTSGIQNGLVSAVEAISAAVQGMASGLEWISKAIESLNNAGALAPILEGIGAAIATYFTASAIMNVVNFFKAFSAGQAIFAALNPHILAIAAAVAGLVALISWAHNQVKLEDKTWGDYKEFDLQEIELQADATLNPKVTNGEEAMQAINDQIAQMVERGTFGEDVGAKLSEMFSQYITPEGMDWEAWYKTGHSSAMDLLNGISEGMESSTEMPNPADDIVQTMNQTFESVTGQSIDFSSMYSGMDTAADQAASDALATLNGIASDMESSGFETAGSEAAQGYAQGLQNGDTSGAAAAVVTATEEAVRGAQQSGSPAAAFMPIGAEAAQGYGMGLQQEDVASYAEAFASAAMAAVTAATQTEAAALTLEAEGTIIASTFAAGITTGSAQATAAITTAGNSISSEAGSVDLASAGSSLMGSFSSGLASNVNAAISTMRAAGSGIKSAASSINLTATGMHVMNGLVVGMNAMRGTLMATARNIANQLKQTIQSGMQVHSPSRFTDWIGRMTGLGLINSLEKITPKVTAAAAAMAVGVTSAFTPLAAASPSISQPAAVTQEYTASGISQASATISPYDTVSPQQQNTETSGERRIVVEIQGGGRIDISGLTREQAMELIAERVKPELMNILSKEIIEGGNGVYEF